MKERNPNSSSDSVPYPHTYPDGMHPKASKLKDSSTKSKIENFGWEKPSTMCSLLLVRYSGFDKQMKGPKSFLPGPFLMNMFSEQPGGIRQASSRKSRLAYCLL